MTNDDEKFFAWLDGELSGVEAAAMEARVAADPELQRIAEQHRAMQARLRTVFDAVEQAPVPQSLRDAMRSKQRSKPIDFAAWRERLRMPNAFGPAPQWAALAATLVIGVLVGTLVGGGTSGSPVELRGNEMVAASYLDDALDTQLASAPTQDGVRIGLTFRDSAGRICRSFTAAGSSGLACRDDSDWQVQGLFGAPEEQSGDYRMAAGTDPNLAALIDSSIRGEPFDAAQEKAARENRWR